MIAIITGSNGEIGKAICKKLISEGCTVIGTDIQKKSKLKINYLQFDLEHLVTDYERSEKIIANYLASLSIKKIDLLVNNAALQNLDNLETITPKVWQKVNNVNVGGPLFLTKILHSYLWKKTKIINIGSIHSKLTKKNFLSYSVSKGALNALTRSLGIHLGEKCTVNSIEPAAIETNMLKEGFGKDFQNKLDTLKSMHPTKSIGNPNEVAELVYMLSSKSLNFLNGASIDLTGGISSVLHDPGEL